MCANISSTSIQRELKMKQGRFEGKSPREISITMISMNEIQIFVRSHYILRNENNSICKHKHMRNGIFKINCRQMHLLLVVVSLSNPGLIRMTDVMQKFVTNTFLTNMAVFFHSLLQL